MHVRFYVPLPRVESLFIPALQSSCTQALLAFKAHALGFFLPMPDPQTVLEGYFYVGTSLCSPCVFYIFGTRAVFSMDVGHLFLQCMLGVIPLIGGATDDVVT